ARAELRNWPARRGEWACMALGPGGRVAAGGEDGILCLHDADGGRELARWQAHDGPVTALALHPGGEALASAGADGTLKLWDLAYRRRGRAALGLDWPGTTAGSPSHE